MGPIQRQGLNLEDWLRLRADQEIRPRKGRYTVAELIQQCDPNAKLSDEDLVLDVTYGKRVIRAPLRP